MANIYVVEDDENIREIECFALKNSGHEVSGMVNAAQFDAALQKGIPDLIILDIMLPDKDGLTILKELRENESTRKIPIIMVTAKTTELDKVKGLDMGADDYLSKPFGVMELISRVKALLRRSGRLENETCLKTGTIILDLKKHTVMIGTEPCELTYKEYELLKLFMENQGTVLSREILMDRIWGTDYIGESRTLDMHIKTLRQKLKEESARIKTVRNVGYKME